MGSEIWLSGFTVGFVWGTMICFLLIAAYVAGKHIQKEKKGDVDGKKP